MADPLRIELAGGLYHVTFRSDRREDIFLSEEDRAEWLERLLLHEPGCGEHLGRYYGWYSNRARGKRKAETAAPQTSITRVGSASLLPPAKPRRYTALPRGAESSRDLPCPVPRRLGG